MEDLEEGEIVEEKSPVSKKRKHSLEQSSNMKYPFIKLNIPKVPLNIPKPYIFKSHKKASVTKDNKKYEKEKWIANSEDMPCSKSFQDERTIKKVSPFRASNKVSHNFNHSRLNNKSSTSRTGTICEEFDSDEETKFIQNSSVGAVSYSNRYGDAINSKTNHEPTYEDLLHQYKSIRSELARLPNERIIKSKEPLKVHRSKSNSSKRKFPTSQFKPNKKAGRSNSTGSSISKTTPAKCNRTPPKRKEVPAKQKVVTTKQKEVPVKQKEVPVKQKEVPVKQKEVLEKVTNTAKPIDDDYLDFLRNSALATCAKLPPSPVLSETNMENAALIPTVDTFGLPFTDDNYEVVDMEVSANEEEDDSLLDDAIIEIPREVVIPELVELDDDDDEEEEQILRARLLLSLKQNEPEETDLKDISDNKNTNPNLIVLSNHETEPLVCSNDVPVEKVSENETSEDISQSVQNISEKDSEVLAEVQFASNSGDVSEMSQTAVSNLSEVTTADDMLANDVSENMPNSKNNILENGLLRNTCQNQSLENDVNDILTNKILNDITVENVIDNVVAMGITSNITNRTPDSTSTKDDSLKVQPLAAHQMLSVTCRSDNLSRKVQLTKRKPLPFVVSEPVKPLVIQFQKDSSESELESDADAPENSTLAGLERLIENAKHKSETPVPQEANKTVPSLSVPKKRTITEASAKINPHLKKLSLAYNTYQEEMKLCSKLKAIANRRKSSYVDTQTEVLRLKTELSNAEKVKNIHQKAMFTANARVAEVLKSLSNRKESIKKMETDITEVGIQLYGPDYVLPNMNSPFLSQNKPL